MTDRSPEALTDPDNFNTEQIANFPANIEAMIHGEPFSFDKATTDTLMAEGFQFRAMINGRSFADQLVADAEQIVGDERQLWPKLRGKLGGMLGWLKEQI